MDENSFAPGELVDGFSFRCVAVSESLSSAEGVLVVMLEEEEGTGVFAGCTVA